MEEINLGPNLQISGKFISQDIIIFPDRNYIKPWSLNDLRAIFGGDVSVSETEILGARGIIVHNATFVLNRSKCCDWEIEAAKI
jgi:hypothetical protein